MLYAALYSQAFTTCPDPDSCILFFIFTLSLAPVLSLSPAQSAQQCTQPSGSAISLDATSGNPKAHFTFAIVY